MKIKDFFNENGYIDFDFVDSINCFRKLKETPQNTHWHKEGNAWEHTKLVVLAMYSILNEYSYLSKTEDEWKILVIAALCHDLGKGETTKFDEAKNEYTSKDHSIVGERITRSLLKDEDILLREKICYLVRHHMILHHIFDDPSKIDFKLKKLSRGIESVRNMIYLWVADSYGSINDETNTSVLAKRETLIHRAIELDIYDKINAVTYNDIAKFCSYHGDFNKDTKPFDVYIMCGFPGSGKSTYVKNNFGHLPIISRDIVRCNLNINGATEENQKKTVGTKEEERKVTEIINKQMNALCRDGKSFVIDNIHLKSQYRHETIKRIIKYKPTIHIIYIEAPSFSICKQRRNGEISSEVYNEMKKKFDFPQLTECNTLTIVKQINRGNLFDITYVIDNNIEIKTNKFKAFDTLIAVGDVVKKLEEAKEKILNNGYSINDCCISVVDGLINEYKTL